MLPVPPCKTGCKLITIPSLQPLEKCDCTELLYFKK